MKRTKLIVLAAATMALGLTACGNKNNNKNKTVEEIAAGFETSVAGKLSFNYSAKYKVDVDSHTDNKDAMASFKHDIDDKVSGEIDLTAGDLYLHIKNEAKDKLVSDTAKVKEALVYKNGASYYYLTSTMENPVALASETAASAKIAELVSKVSANLAGGVTMDTFLYDGLDQEYEYREFGLSSSTVDKSYWEGLTEWSKNDNGGIKAVSKPWYIGYNTDAGVSDFSTPEFEAGDESAYAALIEVNTNEKGYVTAYTENYSNLALDFAIMTPSPTVTIEGSRTFSATYGSDITRLSTINHELTYGTVKFNTSNKGTYEVYTCSADDKAAKTKVADEGQVKVGDLLAVKVTPAGDNTVLAVTYGTVSGQLDTDGYYYFEVQEGTNSITVNFNGSDENEDAEWATVTSITKGEGVASVKVQYMVFPDVSTIIDLDSQNRAPIGASNFLVISPTFEEGYELDKILVNGEPAVNYGAWCFNIATAGNYEVAVTAKSKAPVAQEVTFSVSADAGVDSYSVWTIDGGNPGTLVDVTSAGKATVAAGRFLCVKVELASGAEVVSVKAGDVEANYGFGYYMFDASSAANYSIVIKTTAAAPVTSSTAVVTADAGVESYKVGYLPAGAYAPTYLEAPYTWTPAEGDRLAIQVVLAEGASITSVKIDGVEATSQYGMYFTTVSVAATHSIVVTTDYAVTSSTAVVTADAGVESYKVGYLPAGAYAPTYLEAPYTWTPAEGDRLAIQLVLVEGKTVDSVKIDGVEATSQYGMYFTTVSVAVTHSIVVVTR